MVEILHRIIGLISDRVTFDTFNVEEGHVINVNFWSAQWSGSVDIWKLNYHVNYLFNGRYFFKELHRYGI